MTLDRDMTDSLRSSIKNYLQFTFRIEPNKITDDTPLFSSGLIDSLSVLDFVMFVERETSRPIRPAEITLDNLDSIERILRLLGSDARQGAT